MLVKDQSRSLARIVTIDALKPIAKSDFLEFAVIGGWESIVSKGMYQPGSKALFLEVDAAISYDAPILANFDKKRLKVIEDNNEKYIVIKSIRMRGVLGQGLILNINNNKELNRLSPGTDVSDRLDVTKYVSPEEAKLYYKAELEAEAMERNNKIGWFRKLMWKLRAKLVGDIIVDGLLPFPAHVSRSEQPRAQNIGNVLMASSHENESFEISVKLNGESITGYSELGDNYSVGIAQRNYALRTKDVPYTRTEALRVFAAGVLTYVIRKCAGAEVTFPSYKSSFKATDTPSVKLFLTTGILERLRALNENLASNYPIFPELEDCRITVQGECVGPDFHGNAENTPENEFYVYTVYANGSRVLSPTMARTIAAHLRLNYVPVIHEAVTLPATIKELMAMADGKGVFDPTIPREGIVGKSNSSDISFKAISNKWLMRNDVAE